MGKTLKRGLSVFLVAIMLLSSLPLANFNGFEFGLSASAAGGSVAKFITNVSQKSYVPSGYTGIYTASDLYNIRSNSSGKYILMNDIDLLTWGEWKSFNANGLTLDGNGYSICNLVNYEYGFIYRGYNDVTIKNLGFENVYIDSTYLSVGGIIGFAENVTITNCYVTGSVSARANVGGLCGEYDWDGYINISNCYNFADVSGSGYVGGIAGYLGAWQFEDISIVKCFNRGNITAEDYDVGGIVGYTYGYGDQTDLYIKECANLGSVKGKKNVGGIAGRISGTYAYVRTLDCYNVGSIRGTENVGGLYGDANRMIGSSYNAGTVSGNTNVDAVIGLPNTTLYNCFYLNTMTSKTNAKALSSSAMKKESSFVNGSNYPFDFTNIWKITSGYPTLRCFSRMSWAFSDLSYNQIVALHYADGKIKIKTVALSEDGTTKKSLDGAEVVVKCGGSTELKLVSENGYVRVDMRKLLSRGNKIDYLLKYATIVAKKVVEEKDKYKVEISSENLDANGVWRAPALGDIIKASSPELLLDEPILTIVLSVAYDNVCDFDRIVRETEKLRSLLPQMTNGHVYLRDVSYTSFGVLLPKGLNFSEHDILIYKGESHHSEAAVNGFWSSRIAGAHIYTCNDEYETETICHELGHYVFGFRDEYCYGGGYDYNGKENGGYWNIVYLNENLPFETDGLIPRPIGAPGCFGIMESQFATIEMSNKASYDYLDKNDLSKTDDMNITPQYKEYGHSCEEQLKQKLNSLVNGYGVNYTYSEQLQSAMYSIDEISETKTDTDNITVVTYGNVLDDISETTNPICHTNFEVTEDTLSVEVDSSNVDVYYLSDSFGDITPEKISLTQISDDQFNGNVDIKDTSSTMLYIVDSETNECNIFNVFNIGNVNFSESESFSFANTEYDINNDNYDQFIVTTKTVTEAGELCSYNDKIQIFGDEIDSHLSSIIISGSEIDYSSLSWYKVEDELIPLETSFSAGENSNIFATANITKPGEYVLLANKVDETPLDPISTSNINVTQKDAIYDDQLFVSVNGYEEETEILYCEVYYSGKPFTASKKDTVSHTTFAWNNVSMPIMTNFIEGKQYISVELIYSNGQRTALSENKVYTIEPTDSNTDGIPDYWLDIYYPLKDFDDVANIDCDDDGLNNLQEYQLGTDPLNSDTDGDNVYDNEELQNSLDPLKQCTDGVTDDYVVVYGEPDVEIKNVTFDDSNLTFDLVNNTDGKAVRNFVAVEADGEEVAMWTVNIDTQSTVGFTVPLADIEGCESLDITSDEGQITHDKDYTNNTFTYSPASSIAFEKESFEGIKGNNIVPTLVLEPDTANEIFAWSIEGAPNLSIDSSTGVVTSNGIGTGKVTVKTLRGLTAICDVYSIAFEGAEYSEFDSKLINNDTEVAITGYIGDDSSIIIPETIGSLPVTQLASNAFKGCSFNEVTIHSGINSIANNTFSDTISLERIVVYEDNTSYCSVDGILYNADKTQLVKYPSAKTDTIFAIPETVTSVGAYSLNDCDYIEEITVPENVTSIGNSAISNCNNLKTVNYNAISCSTPSGFSALLYGVFNSSNQIEKVIIGDNVEVIPQYLFYNRSNLSEVIISDNSNLLTIAQCAFYGCSKLTKFEIPETVTAIGSSAFYGCGKLDNIVLPEALISIGSSAFSGCSSLTSIAIPETVKTIDSNTFYSCSNLSDVTLPKTLTTIGSSAFSGCSSLTSIVIPETVTSIPNNCFANCTSLEKIVIPAQVDTIGETPFNGCSNVVIWCYYKSVAHEYAIANSISYRVMELDTEDLIVTGVQETIVEGLQYQITTEISPVDSDETVMYSSSDDNIFSVTDTGLITAKGAGEAILTVASSRGSVSKTFNINVLGLVKDSENANLYHVRNADDMLALSTMVNSGVSFAGKIIQLDNDIDLSNIDWTPIGVDSTNVFSGVFDGKNHTITGLNYSTTSNTYSGLFGYIKTGGVKDLTVEGSVNGVNRVGMLAGCIFDSALYNCKVIGEVKRIGSGSYGYVGGLVGSALHSVIINCAAETDITVDFGSSSIYYSAVGGIVGAASTAGSDPMCILNSYCIGDINVNGNNYYSTYENYYVGGIAGYLKDDAVNNYYFGEITNADEDPIKKIGYAFGYVVPEYTSESDYNGIGTIIVQDSYYLEGKNAIGLISEGDYDSTDWTSAVSTENFSKLIGEGSLVDKLNENKAAVEEIIVAHRDILSNSTWAELVDRINGDSFTVSSWKIGSNNLPVNYECDCYRHAESEWIIDVEATCTKEGSKHTYCLVCQETVTTSIIEKVEHKFSDWTETKAATCTEKGSEYRTCTTCNSATETRDIAELGHNFVGEWTTDKAPTCTKSGVESRICTRCKSEKETRTVDKLGHDFESKWTVDKEATCSKVGSKSHHCSRCDEKSDVTVVNKIAHTYRESVQEATCTKDGKKTYNCSACGDSYSEVITAKGHIDQNGDGKCDKCDYIYDNTCDHMCHKSGFMGFIWKIVRFFWKLFKMNPICECGVSHY